jgi:uncharacterized membrane protein YoaT (DUF817 family)
MPRCSTLLTYASCLLQLKALSASFTRTRDAYNACQAEIVLKAVNVAATYAGVFRDIADKIGTYLSYHSTLYALCAFRMCQFMRRSSWTQRCCVLPFN